MSVHFSALLRREAKNLLAEVTPSLERALAEASQRAENQQRMRDVGFQPVAEYLALGDAPGDHKAAVANDCLFFPINPGNEEASWQRLSDEGIDRFFDGTFPGKYQQMLLDEFHKYLPNDPPWPVE